MACCGYTTINQQRLTFLSQPNSSTFFKTSYHTKSPMPEPQTRKLPHRQMRSEKSSTGLSTHQMDHTAGTLKKEYKQLAKYSNRVLHSALTSLQIKKKKEVG
eukprot:11994860-Ditylum_brightwellii.AAC.1